MMASEAELPALLLQESARVVTAGNTTQTLLNLISIGDDTFGSLSFGVECAEEEELLSWSVAAAAGETRAARAVRGQQGLSWLDNVPHRIAPLLDKVPGCMADVRVCTTTAPPGVIDTVYGNADSRVARGMLALLKKGLEGASVTDVLAMDSRRVAGALGLESLLPQGRLDGLCNIVGLIQQQCTTSSSSSSSSASTAARDGFPASWSDRHNEVAVLLSGGVDSSVALALLVQARVPVRAFYLKIWLEDEVAHLNECPWEEDMEYAQAVCAKLGVPLETISLQREYWDHVVQYTFREARKGLTPNPDVMCNSRIKFGMFFQYVGQHFKRVATGHYAQLGRLDGGTVVSPLSDVGEDTGPPVCPPPLQLGALTRPLVAYSGASKGYPNHEKTPPPMPSSAVLTFDEDDSPHGEPAEEALGEVGAGIGIGAGSGMEDVDLLTEWLSTTASASASGSSTALALPPLLLFRSPDSIKDQTYFLCALTQAQLSKATFPIGHLQKSQVRELAEQFDLPTKARKDSQGICFLGKLKFSDFIRNYLGEEPGEIVDYKSGELLGRHRGLWFHTIGQRKGLGPYLTAPGSVNAGPWYVVGKDADRNIVYTSNDESVLARPRLSFLLGEVVWSFAEPPPELLTRAQGLRLLVQLRHGGEAVPATLSLGRKAAAAAAAKGTMYLRVILDAADKGIAPGQFAALYVGEVCIGSGVVVDEGAPLLD